MTLDKASGVEEVGGQILAAAMRVHSALGPGLLEGVYEICLTNDLGRLGLRVERQMTLPLEYEGQRIEAGYRLDLLAEGMIVVEVKAVEKLMPIHLAQVVTYLRLGKYPLGYLLNFNVLHMRQGIKRVVM
ncbi:MAG TPA: GxxExxY protein [Burkholderiales bacterium]|jgi:GxxExxY protein|nr:GxxExxY protein [Burkholderiales bacterium]